MTPSVPSPRQRGGCYVVTKLVLWKLSVLSVLYQTRRFGLSNLGGSGLRLVWHGI